MKRYIFSILFIIFLSITIFSCKKDLLQGEEEVVIVGHLYRVMSRRGSFATTLLLKRQEKANGEIYYVGHVYSNGQTYYKQYYFDEFDKKTIDEFAKYEHKIIKIKGYITNGSRLYYPYILNPKLIEVKDIDYYTVSQTEDWTNADSYIWK